MSSEFLDKEIIFINSAVRNSGLSDDFTIDISSQISIPNNYDYCSLLNFSCPKSYYLFDNNNNQFVVNENGSLTTITITNGNYNFTSLKNELTTQLGNCSWTYVVAADKRTGKYLFTVSGNSGIQPIFDFSKNNSPYLILGFEQELYNFAADILRSENVVNIQLTNTIELMSDLVDKSVLSVIVPSNGNFTFITYNEQNPSFAGKKLIKKNFQNARFYLIDGQSGRKLNLNGLDFNFSIVLYKINDYYQNMIVDRLAELEQKSLDEDYQLNN